MGKNKKAAAAAPGQPVVAADGAVWYGVDEAKVKEKFLHYDVDGNGKLDPQEVVALSVDLYHAFNPGKTLTDAEIKDVHDKLIERIDEKHGDHDGMIEFDEFLPWYAQAAEKHWKMVHGLIRAEDHDSSQGVSTPLDTPLQRKAAPVGQQAMRSAPPPPPEQQKMRSAPPPPPPGEGAPYKTGTRSDVNYDEVFKGGFPASTTIFATDAPETLEGGAVRVSSLEQALKVIGDNNAKILIARRLNLKDDGTAKLADALKKNKCLEEIYLSQNNIGVPGAKAMAGAVEVHPTLKELYMGYNLITEEGAKALIDAGGKSKTLKVLDVDCDGVKQTPKPADGNIEAVCDFFNE